VTSFDLSGFCVLALDRVAGGTDSGPVSPARAVVVAGLTGTGKSVLLNRLREAGAQVLDLQALAAHAGSAFGGLGRGCQPTHRDFQANVLAELAATDPRRAVWVEDCPAYMGSVGLPPAMELLIRTSPIVLLERPRQERIDALVEEYGPAGRDAWASALAAMSGRLGRDNAARAGALLDADDLHGCTDVLLDYYDAAYRRAHATSDREVLAVLTPDGVQVDGRPLGHLRP